MKKLILDLLESYIIYENSYDSDLQDNVERVKGSFDNLLREYLNNPIDDYSELRVIQIINKDF